MAKKKVIKSKTNTKKKTEVKSTVKPNDKPTTKPAAKAEVKTQEKKKNKKKVLIPLFCLLGAGALAGAGVGIYFAVKAKPAEIKFDASCETDGVSLSNNKAIKGKDYITEISVSEEKISAGYTLPTSLIKVVSGNRTLKIDTDPKEYTYELKENNKAADFKILGEFVEGDITIELNLVPPKEKHNVYWYNYDGTLLEEDIDVEEGTIPTYDGEDPTNYGDEKTKQTWTGDWDHEPEAVGKTDQTYTATYTPETVSLADFFIGVEFRREQELIIADPITLNITYTGEAPTVDWGDGASSNDTTSAVHTYTKTGQYGIRVSGNVTNISLTTGSSGQTLPFYAREVYFGNSIVSIGNTFQRTSLKSVRFGSQSTLTTIGQDTFVYCESLKSINIPSSVTTIGDAAFNNSGLEEITFGDNSKLVSIGARAFQGTNLKTVNIPKNIDNTAQTLETQAFGGCEQLSEIYIPSTMQTVKEHIVFGSTIKNIFCGPTAKPDGWATTWNVLNSQGDRAATLWDYAYIGKNNDGCIYAMSNANEATILRYEGDAEDELVLPDTINNNYVKFIDKEAFYDNNFSTIVLPDHLIEIGEAAFGHSNKLEAITIPASVKIIGDNAFFHSPKGKLTLEQLIFAPNSELTTIGDGAFWRSSITELELPNQLDTIGMTAFLGSESLESVTITSANSIGDRAFCDCTKLKEVDLTALDTPPTLEEGTKGIQVFDGCDSTLTFYVKDVATQTAFKEAPTWAPYKDKIVVRP